MARAPLRRESRCECEVLPLNGTREGLFLAPFIVTPEMKAGSRPAILLPNPFYQCYAAAILSCGAEPVFVRADAASGFLPDFASLPKSVLERTAAAYICSPSNPEGAVASEAYWRNAVRARGPLRLHGVRRRVLRRHLSRQAADGCAHRARGILRAAAELPFAVEAFGHAGAALRDSGR